MGFKEDFPDLKQEDFPNLLPGTYVAVSPLSEEYNCIAWAAGDDLSNWWPIDLWFWPENVKREDTLAAFSEAFATLGYVPCEDGSFEDELEKVVIYAVGSEPTHAARQKSSGLWTSKLGGSRDIDHELEAVSGPLYGRPALFLQRKR